MYLRAERGKGRTWEEKIYIEEREQGEKGYGTLETCWNGEETTSELQK